MGSVAVKHRIEYFALRIVAFCVRRLPRRGALAFGHLAGRLVMKVLPGRYRLAKDNMMKALPDLSAAELEENIRKNFEHIGASGVEMLRLDMLKPGSDDLQRYFVFENMHILEEALALKRGVILLTGHLGFWEAGHFALSELGIPFATVAKPLKNPLSERYFAKIRTTFGTTIINSRKGVRQILKSLHENCVVGILLDQHISPPGAVPTAFFGRQAYTTTAITSLAMKHQVPIVPVFCLRQPDGRHKIWAEPMLLLDKDGRSVADNTQRLTDIIEAAVRKDISQWFWMHKRWRVKASHVKEKTGE
jgi:KDO2-lipid IV(A) lauroyltransferase